MGKLSLSLHSGIWRNLVKNVIEWVLTDCLVSDLINFLTIRILQYHAHALLLTHPSSLSVLCKLPPSFLSSRNPDTTAVMRTTSQKIREAADIVIDLDQQLLLPCRVLHFSLAFGLRQGFNLPSQQMWNRKNAMKMTDLGQKFSHSADFEGPCAFVEQLNRAVTNTFRPSWSPQNWYWFNCVSLAWRGDLLWKERVTIWGILT